MKEVVKDIPERKVIGIQSINQGKLTVFMMDGGKIPYIVKKVRGTGGSSVERWYTYSLTEVNGGYTTDSNTTFKGYVKYLLTIGRVLQFDNFQEFIDYFSKKEKS